MHVYLYACLSVSVSVYISVCFYAYSDKWPQVRLITGAVRGKAREHMLEEIRSCKVDIVVGTHALLTEAVADSIVKLGLVVGK